MTHDLRQCFVHSMYSMHVCVCVCMQGRDKEIEKQIKEIYVVTRLLSLLFLNDYEQIWEKSKKKKKKEKKHGSQWLGIIFILL